MNILILDDDLYRHKEFNRKFINHTVKNVYEVWDAIEALKKYVFDYVFLDHSLGGKIHQTPGDGTGYEVAKWLYDNPDKQPKHIIIHSFDVDGPKKMKGLLPQAVLFPGVWIEPDPMNPTLTL